jgi:hypothetical protein
MSDPKKKLVKNKEILSQLFDFISKSEGTSQYRDHGYESPYDVPVGFGKYRGVDWNLPKKLSEMTVQEVIEAQKAMVHKQRRARIPQSNRSSAVGKYQFLMTNLEEALQKGIIKPTDTFSEDTQDKLAYTKLQQRGFDRFLKSEKTDKDYEEFQYNLAKEWASIPVPIGRTTSSGKKVEEDGRAYYDTNDQSKAHYDSIAFRNMLDTVISNNIEPQQVDTNAEPQTDVIQMEQPPTPMPLDLRKRGRSRSMPTNEVIKPSEIIGRSEVVGGTRQLDFGGFLKKNAGVIGGVLGAAAGTIVAPGAGTMMGAKLGGMAGGLAGGVANAVDKEEEAPQIQEGPVSPTSQNVAYFANQQAANSTPGFKAFGGPLRTDGPRASLKDVYLPLDGNRPSYTNAEGKQVSENKIGVGMKGKEYVLPTVVDGKQLTEDEAIERYKNTGEHMGVFDTIEEANRAAALRTNIYNTDPAYRKKMADGGPLNDKEKNYRDAVNALKVARQAIGTNDTKKLDDIGLDKRYNSNNLAEDFSEAQKLRKEAGLGIMEEAKILFPHIGQQIRGSLNNALGTHFAMGGKMNSPITFPQIFKGPRHEQGGIPIGNNTEVEGNEVKWKDYIFSDRF